MALPTLAAIILVASWAMAVEVPKPRGGDDHAWMTYASLAVLPAEDLEWLGPEIKPLISTYCHLPDLNWNNYGEFGGWSGLPDQPRTPDSRREWEIHEFTGFNHATGAGRRFGHAPPDAYEAVAWHMPRILERLRNGEYLHGIIQMGVMSHYVQDSSTFAGTQALHRAARFDTSRISAGDHTPTVLGEDIESATAAAVERTKQMVAMCDAQADDLRAAMQASDAEKEAAIRAACCGEASKIMADVYHTLIELAGRPARPGPPPLNTNLVANPGVEEEDAGERLPRHWVVGYNDLEDRVGRALWEGKILRETRLWHQGRCSLKLMWTPAKGLEWRQTWPSALYVRPGDYYAASAWVKTYAATGETTLVIAFHADDLQPVSEVATAPIAGDTDWQRVTVAAPVPAGAVKARVILRSVANEGAAWFDDIELVRVDEAGYQAALAAEPTGDTLVLHLPFDGDANDHSVFSRLNGPIAMLSGTQRANLLQAGEPSGFLRLDGEDDFVEVPHSHVEDVLSPAGEMTLSLWLRIEGADGGFVCGKADEANGRARGFRLSVTPDGTAELAVALGGKWTTATAPLPSGKWCHVAATRDAAGGLRVWVDGKPGETTPTQGDFEPSDHSLYIGADHGVSSFLKGDIDDLRLYRVALSDQEIGSLARER